jgi:serine/threonine protein kinase
MIALRDFSDLNIMLDGTPLYPKGFHPSAQTLLPSGQRRSKPLRRADVPSVKYYITDFGISSHFPDPSRSCLVTGLDAQDKDVPELSRDVPYDPFAVDIWTLGSVYKRNFLNVSLPLVLSPMIAIRFMLMTCGRYIPMCPFCRLL